MRFLASHRTYAVLATLVLAAVVFLNGLGTFHTDIKPEIYIRPWTMLVHYISSWTSSPYLGSPNFNVGLAPVLLVLSGLRGIGMNPEFAFKTLHFVLLILSAVGAARLVRALVPKSGPWLTLLAAVFFVANPYTITAGATLAIALPMAFLPWMLLCLIHALRRPDSWAWPALLGITFFLMSGMNVAVVPLFSLLAFIPIIAALWRDYALNTVNVGIVVLRSALFVVLFSLYWLVPALVALGTGSQIVEGSETLDGIAKVSSLPEVLRGLGLWPLYGSGSIGPWVPEHAIYLTGPFILVLSMLWPTLGLLGLLWANNRVRIFITISVLMTTVIMVGVFPSEDAPASPFGMLLRELLQIPMFSAFRTTNKIGAVLALSLALGIAVLLVYLVPRWWKIVPVRASLSVAIATVFVAWTLPAFSGDLYISQMKIPDYWTDAAESIDESSQPGTVLVLPGQVRPNYRWTEERPDDVLNSVLDRRAIIPETTPNASPPAVNFLSALDGAFQSGTASDDVVSGMARYLGVGQVLLRHDVVWENTGGARPAQTSRQIGSDPGLYGRENFGKEGQNVLSPAMEDPFFFGEHFLPPLQVYDVQATHKPVRALSLDRGLIVAGDGFAFPQMLAADMLGSTPLIRYAHDISSEDFGEAVADSERLVLTDTNMRRNVISNRLTAGHSQLLTASDDLGVTRTLGSNTDDQTVREDEVIEVETTQSGSLFFDLPYGSGQFAFDGDLATAWRFGDFGTGVGQSITATFDEPRVLETLQIAQMKVGDAVIDEIEVAAGGRKFSANLPESGIQKIDLGGVETEDLMITIKSLDGDGYNFVAISEINIDGLRSEPVARMPLTFANHWDELDSEARQLFTKTPLDILMTRVQNTESISDDSETVLDRRFELQDGRTFTTEGDIRVKGSVEHVYDQLEGRSNQVRTSSSGFYFDNREVRASRAADHDDTTAWIPGGGTRDAWWQIDSGRRSVSGVTIVQERQPGVSEHHRANRVEILIDDEIVAEAPVRYGENRITFAEPVVGSSVRMRIVGLAGDPDTAPPRFTTIDTGISMGPKSKKARDCLVVATVGDQDLMMKPSDDRLARNNQPGTGWESCGDISLDVGTHRLTQSHDFIIDRLALRDVQSPVKKFKASPIAEVLKDGNTHKQIHVRAADSGYAVVAGQGVNTNWRARIGGQDLGPAQTLNGYSSGWIIPDGRAAVIDMEYIPQRWSYAALFATILGLLVSLTLIVRAAATKQLFAKEVLTPLDKSDSRSVLTRPVLEAVFIVASGLLGGLAALVSSAVFVGIQRGITLRGGTWIFLGAGTIFMSVLAYLAVLIVNDLLGEVSADSIAMSLWPHYLAVAGLVWLLAGVVWKTRKG